VTQSDTEMDLMFRNIAENRSKSLLGLSNGCRFTAQPALSAQLHIGLMEDG